MAAIAIVVSIVSAFISAVLGINSNYFASQANATASKSNQIASEAKYESSYNAEADRRLQQSIAEMQQAAKRPALELLRFNQFSPTEFYAAIQNSGERHAAMFEIVCQKNLQTGYRSAMPDTIATIPIKNSSEFINVRFNRPEEGQHVFQPPSKLAPGEIVTFRLSVSEAFDGGEFLLFFNAREHIHLGRFSSNDPPSFLDAPIGGIN